MSYIRLKEKSGGSLWDLLTFKSFSPKQKCIKFMNEEYTDEDEEYNGLASIFDNCDEGVWPSYNIVFPVGIPNLGNTCYMNALFQSLISCEELEKYIKVFHDHMYKSGYSHGSEDEDNISTSDSESDAEYFTLENSKFEEHKILKSFIDAYYALKNGERSCEAIVKFYDHLCEKFTYIFEQEDAHELLMVIFNLFTEYAKKQTLYRPRLAYMKVIKYLCNLSGTEAIKDEKESAFDEEKLKASLSTNSSSIILTDQKCQTFKRFADTEKNLEAKLHAGVRTGFEGLTNPFTAVYASRFHCLECRDYSWTTHEIRYVLTVS